MVSVAILFGADAMPLSQKFFFILVIFLLSVPGILLTLLQLTCLVTGAGLQNQRWWCSLYSWIMSAFVILYSVLIVIATMQVMAANRETFRGMQNGFVGKEFPATYPFDAGVNTPKAPYQDPTTAYSEQGQQVSETAQQYMLRMKQDGKDITEPFAGAAAGSKGGAAKPAAGSKGAAKPAAGSKGAAKPAAGSK